MDNQNVDYTVVMIPMDEIFSDPDFNCRDYISPIDVMNLARDIKHNGLQTPITVEPYEHEGKKYRIIAGHRRHKACLINEMTEIPAFIREGLSELDARILNLNENIARKELSIYEEAKAIKHLVDLGMTERQVMDSLGRKRGWVQTRFMLLKLPKEVQEEARIGSINQQTIRDAYTVLINGGTNEEIFEVVRKYKEAKEKGVALVRNQKKGRTSPKRRRETGEIFKLQDVIRKMFGNGLTTRCLAWCGGVISNEDLLETLEDYAIKMDKIVPEDIFLK